MPEGHTIHRLAQTHRPFLRNKHVDLSSPQGRFRNQAKRLSGRKIIDVEAIGKHLLYKFAGTKPRHPEYIHIHLGLYGKFRDQALPAEPPIGQVRLRIISPTRCIDLNGPNQCEIMSSDEYHELKNRLGPDPLRPDGSAELFFEKTKSTKKSIGAVLLDQARIAGIGNIYRSEILFNQKIDPFCPANQLTRTQIKKLWNKITSWMDLGVKYNRIITRDARRYAKDIDAQKQKNKRKLGTTNDERFYVYKVTQCHGCQTRIKSVEQSARTLYYCPICQTN